MFERSGPAWRLSVIVLTAVLAIACGPQVTVPPASGDQPPVITIENFLVGGVGRVDQAESNATTRVTVTAPPNAHLMLFGGATNPGGIQRFSIAVSQGGVTTYSATVTGARDANNQAPSSLMILGTDGAGGQGPNAMLINVTSQKAILTATASTFSGLSRSITVTYVPINWTDPASLYVAYWFQNDGREAFDVSVRFTGTMTEAARPGEGETSFDVTPSSGRVGITGGSVGGTVPNLRQGKWTVVAAPLSVGGPITCTSVYVPGRADFNYNHDGGCGL